MVCSLVCWADDSIIGEVFGGCRGGSGVFGCGVAHIGVA